MSADRRAGAIDLQFSNSPIKSPRSYLVSRALAKNPTFLPAKLPTWNQAKLPFFFFLYWQRTSIMASIFQAKKTALITGAASGVGFAIAKLCRSKGMHLALMDIDQTNLVKAKTMLHDLNPGLLTEAYMIDVADSEIWKATAQQIAKLFPSIDLVVLNAGKGYKAQNQGNDKLSPWVDGEYWQKVCFSLNNSLMMMNPSLNLPHLRLCHRPPFSTNFSSSPKTRPLTPMFAAH